MRLQIPIYCFWGPYVENKKGQKDFAPKCDKNEIKGVLKFSKCSAFDPISRKGSMNDNIQNFLNRYLQLSFTLMFKMVL